MTTAPARRSHLVWLLAAFAVSLDATTTYIGLTLGVTSEANPVLRELMQARGVERALAIKVIVSAVAFLVLAWCSVQDRWHLLREYAGMVLILATAITLIVALNNLRLIA